MAQRAVEGRKEERRKGNPQQKQRTQELTAVVLVVAEARFICNCSFVIHRHIRLGSFCRGALQRGWMWQRHCSYWKLPVPATSQVWMCRRCVEHSPWLLQSSYLSCLVTTGEAATGTFSGAWDRCQDSPDVLPSSSLCENHLMEHDLDPLEQKLHSSWCVHLNASFSFFGYVV